MFRAALCGERDSFNDANKKQDSNIYNYFVNYSFCYGRQHNFSADSYS